MIEERLWWSYDLHLMSEWDGVMQMSVGWEFISEFMYVAVTLIDFLEPKTVAYNHFHVLFA